MESFIRSVASLLNEFVQLLLGISTTNFTSFNGDRTLEKTDKASLNRHVEKESVRIDIPSGK